MEDYQSLNHTKWQCKYRIIFIPKYRRRTLFGVVRRELGGCFTDWPGRKAAGSRRGI